MQDIKLFGPCKWAGACICGNCPYYPINARSEVKIVSADGRVRYIYAAVWSAIDRPDDTWVFGNSRRKSVTKCGTCGIGLTVRHVCKGPRLS